MAVAKAVPALFGDHRLVNAVFGAQPGQGLPVPHRLQSHFRLELNRIPLACDLAHDPVLLQFGNNLAPFPNFRGQLCG